MEEYKQEGVKAIDDFMQAAFGGDVQTLENLIKNGVDVNTRNQRGQTAIHIAALSNKINWQEAKDVIAVLLRWGANINLQDNGGNTPLHVVANNVDDDVALLEFLVGRGAKVTIRNLQNQTPHELSITGGRTAIAEWFRKQEKIIARQLRAHSRFFDHQRALSSSRVQQTNKDDIKSLTTQFRSARADAKPRSINIENKSARRLVMADGAALQILTRSYDFTNMNEKDFNKVLEDDGWHIEKTLNTPKSPRGFGNPRSPQSKTTYKYNEETLEKKGVKITSKYNPVQGQIGNFFMTKIGDYGVGTTPYPYNDPFVLSAIYSVTSHDSTPQNSGQDKEKALAKLLLEHLKTGAEITLQTLLQANLYPYPDKNDKSKPDSQKNAPTVQQLNNLLILTGIKEITRRMHGSRLTLPLGIAYIQGLKLVQNGHLRMKDLFAYDAPYGLPTTAGLGKSGADGEKNRENAKEKLRALNTFYLEKYPTAHAWITKQEYFHELLRDNYGGRSDTEGEAYSDASDLNLDEEISRLGRLEL